MPSNDSFENIRQCLGATSVCLPSIDDFRKPSADTSKSRPAGSRQRGKRVAPRRSNLRASNDGIIAYNHDNHQNKIWSSVFRKDRAIPARQSCLDALGRSGDQLQGLAALFDNIWELGGSSELRTVQAYFKQLSRVQDPLIARAWVREGSEVNGFRSRWMTADELRFHLQGQATTYHEVIGKVNRQFL